MGLPLQEHVTPPEEFCKHWIAQDLGKKQLKDPRHVRRFDLIAEHAGSGICTAYDIGCATGETTIELWRRLGGYWVGIDFSIGMIKEASNRYCGRYPIEWTYWPCWVTIKNVLHPDLVVCSEVIEHLKNPQPLIDNCLRLAKKRAIFTTPCRLVSSRHHVRLFTKDQLQEMTGGEVFEDGDFFYVRVEKCQ